MLIRHSAAFTAGKLLPGLLGMAGTALLTRLLDPAGYGRYGLALVVATAVSTVCFDWLGLAFLRFAPLGAAVDATVRRLFAAVAGSAALVAAGGWAAGLLGGVVAAGLGLAIASAWFELAARTPVAAGQPGRYLAMNLLRAASCLAGAAGAAWATSDPACTVWGAALGTVAGVACGPRPGGGRFDAGLARRMVAFGLALAGGMAMSAAANSGVRGLLDALGSAAALGVYTAAFLLVQNTLAIVAAGIASAGYPAAVRALESGDADGARRQVAANWRLSLAVLCPMAAGMALTAPGVAALLTGPAFAPAVAALTPWLAGAGLLAGLRAHGLDHPLHLAGRPGVLTAVTAVGAAVAVAATALLVPRYGVEGAGIASFAGAGAAFGAALVAGWRLWPVPLPKAEAVRVAGACAFLAAGVLASPGGLPLQVAAGVAGYGVGCVLFDVLSVRRLLRRRLRERPNKGVPALGSGPRRTLTPALSRREREKI